MFMRHKELMTMGFRPTAEESEAAKTCVFLVVMPVFFVFLAYAEWKLLYVYYRYGAWLAVT